VSHHEEDENLQHKTRGGQTEKICPLMECNSQGNLITFIALIYLYMMRTKQKVSYISALIL